MELQDWWLPHFYQQRSLVLQPSKPARKGKKKAIVAVAHAMLMIAYPVWSNDQNGSRSKHLRMR